MQYECVQYECNSDVLHPFCHRHVTYGFSCVTSLSFTNPVPWLHGILKCAVDAIFRILLEGVGHLCNLWPPQTYYCSLPTI